MCQNGNKFHLGLWVPMCAASCWRHHKQIHELHCHNHSSRFLHFRTSPPATATKPAPFFSVSIGSREGASRGKKTKLARAVCVLARASRVARRRPEEHHHLRQLASRFILYSSSFQLVREGATPGRRENSREGCAVCWCSGQKLDAGEEDLRRRNRKPTTSRVFRLVPLSTFVAFRFVSLSLSL